MRNNLLSNGGTEMSINLQRPCQINKIHKCAENKVEDNLNQNLIAFLSIKYDQTTPTHDEEYSLYQYVK